MDPTEVPTIMYTHEVSSNSEGFWCCEEHILTLALFPQGLRVNGDVDTYVETLQTIVVKPPWIESAANGGRPPYVFQQDSAQFHEALKTQDWMDG
ncbi:hypothetical protein ACTXT7_015907 [Hymenolepis weldensis]